MLKVALFRGEDETGIHTFPLFGPSDAVFREDSSTYATAGGLAVHRVVETQQERAVRPCQCDRHAPTTWGSNVNGDAFTE